MKKIFTFLGLAALTLLPAAIKAEDYLMPKWGYEEKTIAAGETITFYDFNGESDIPSSSSSNSYSTVVFRPAEAGYGINIVFESIEMKDDGSGWVAYLDVFDGVFDKTLVNGGTYPSSVNGNTTPFSQLATPLKHYENGTFSNEKFLSADATGALSVCFHYRYAAQISGWKAIVTVVKMQDMELKSATALYDFIDTQVWKGKQNVAFAGIDIVAEGSGNPDTLQKISFTLEGASVIDAAGLKVYSGKAADVSSLVDLNAVVTESEGVYTATFNKTLGGGDNYFTIGGNILSTAEFNATAKVNVTGIETAGGFKTFTPATPVEVKVAAMYLMSTEASYDINQETLFYDDGGKDGKRSNSFTGHVTFRPATEGKKVQIDFKTISLFYNSSAVGVGNQDVLKIYNGTTVDEDKLLYTVEAASMSNLILKSTSADGALTVYLKTNTPSATMMGDGWEAVVSEFTPQPMVVKTVENSKQTGSTIAAGAEDVQIASVKIVTENTEPALVLKELSLNTNGTFAQISKVKLYYTKDNKFSTANLLGEVAVSADKVTINATNEIQFREGENYLWIAYDIQTLAENDSKVDFVPEKITFTNSAEHSAFSAIEGSLTIKNVAVQACGEQTITVQGEWQYTHTVASGYSSKYKAENCDQTIVFRPAAAGNVIQIDYADFDVYYASSSYSTRAKYIVYAGTGTTGEKLWELDANGKKPVQIRSNAADGALTIVFNPNTTSTYYTGNGWHATVTEYTPQNMKVDNIAVEQASTRLVKLGEQKAEILNIDIKTLGTLSPLTLNEVSVNLKGSEQNVSKVYLMQDDVVLAQADAAASVTLTLATAQELIEYSNVFTIAFDLKEDATVDQTVDAVVTAIKTGETTVSVTNGDPEGSRPIKNVMLLQAGDNGTINIGATSLMFYDDGGADEQYTSNFEGYVTFKPVNEGYAVELVFNDFDIAYLSGDPFRIFYSNAYDSEATPDKKYGMYSKPAENESVISKAADGSLTVYVKMPSSRMRGFEVEVRQHLLTNLAVDSMVVNSLAPAQATKGSSDLQLLQAALYVSGDRTPITVTGFEQTASPLLTDRHIYATGHSATFATTTELTDSYVIDEKGVYYFWFVGGIDANAEVGDKVSLQINNLVCGEVKTAPQQDVVASVNVVSGAHGYYQIGSSNEADYATLTAAIAAISNIGMDGPVVLAVESGTYTEQVTIPEISGSGAVNTLTIRSLTGDYNDVTYQYNGNTLSSTQGVFTIAGTDYVTLKGLSFTSSYTSNQTPTVVVVNNASNHVTIDSCRIFAERYTEYTVRLDLLRVDAGENLYNNDFALTNSVLDGGYMGLNVAGHKAAADPLQKNMLIKGNRIQNQGLQMVYGDAVSNLQIIGNTFRNEVKKSSCAAIDWLLVGDTATISDNDILLTAAASDNINYQAVYFRPNSYQDKEKAVIKIVNNVINARNASTYASYAINFNTNMPKLLVAHNTVVLNSEGAAASPFYIQEAPVAGSRFVNNIFQATSKGYAVRYRNTASINSNITYEHNIVFTPEGNTFGAVSAVESFDKWKTAVGATDEQGNLNEAVVFASENLLLPKQTNEGHLLTAAVLDFVTTDITGKQRSATPTIGAYEYDPDMFVIPQMATGYPVVQNIKDVKADIVLKTNNLGTAKVLVLNADAQAPALGDVLNTGAEVTLNKNAETVFTAEGLTEETSYKAYIVTLSPLSEADTVLITTDIFTTAWTLRPVELKPIDSQYVSESASVTLVAELEQEYEQAKPYSFLWYNVFGDTLASKDTLTINADKTAEYVVVATDKYGQTATLSTSVLVSKQAEMAGFEEYKLAAPQNKYVEDAWADYTPTWLYSGTYSFANTPNKYYNAFNGYAVCSDNSAEYSGNYMLDQFRSAAGGAYEGQNFAIAYYSAPSPAWGFAGYKDTIRLTNTDEPQVISGFYVTNTAYTYGNIINGDYANPAFGVKDSTGAPQKDYLKLTVYGYNGMTRVGTKDFYLADYRDDDPDEHYALDTWQWLSLAELGAVTELQFEMFTTKSNDYGFTTPTYFALDNFGGKCRVDTVETIVIYTEVDNINLDNYFTLEDKGNAVYDAVEETLTDATYTISGNLLQVKATQKGAKAVLVIRRTQRGKQQFKQITVERSGTGTAVENDANSDSVYPTLFSDRLFVDTYSGNCMIEVFAADGRKVLCMNTAGNAVINTGAWQQGHYIVRVTSEQMVTVRPVIKQ
ncbi:MAG: DUF4465 domain-containing protein [Paludibacteraceae bacterium]|nr:DUF4465 domain-containing protein [Paludibacteraceae bacterium]